MQWCAGAGCNSLGEIGKCYKSGLFFSPSGELVVKYLQVHHRKCIVVKQKQVNTKQVERGTQGQHSFNKESFNAALLFI